MTAPTRSRPLLIILGLALTLATSVAAVWHSATGFLIDLKCPGFDGDIEQPEGQSVHGSTAEVPGGVA